MATLKAPVYFDSLELFNEWTKRFEDKAAEICRTHDAMSVWDKTVMLKNEDKREYAIISMGAWLENSDHYRAQNKILDVWDEMFSERGFF